RQAPAILLRRPPSPPLAASGADRGLRPNAAVSLPARGASLAPPALLPGALRAGDEPAPRHARTPLAARRRGVEARSGIRRHPLRRARSIPRGRDRSPLAEARGCDFHFLIPSQSHRTTCLWSLWYAYVFPRASSSMRNPR